MRLIAFYQNLSYCRTCKKDHCDHDDKPLGFWHGRAKLIDYKVGLEWNVGRHNSLNLECEWFDGEGCRDVKFIFGLPFLFTVYFTLHDIISKEIEEPWKKGPRQVAIKWNQYGQFLKIDLGGKSHESSSKDKWWEKGFTFHAPWDSWHLSTEVISEYGGFFGNPPIPDRCTLWREDCRTYWQSLWSRLTRNKRPHRTESPSTMTRESAELLANKRFGYTYTLKSGEVQVRIATCHIERRVWGKRWFPFITRSETALDVSFDGEVGEGTGSWKGGTIGCGYTMLPNETMEMTLRRMERDRKFDR